MNPSNLLFICRQEWKCLVAGSLASVALACLVLFGWPHFLPISLDKPYIYSGDGLASDWLAQRAIEGWIFDNPRSGFPFGSNFLDYPGSDAGSFLILKILGKISGSAVSAVNLYFLLSFPVAFVVSFSVLRYFQIRRSYAACFAMLFSFAPFHFARFFYGHLFYTWYFSVPLFYYYGHKISAGIELFDLKKISSILSLIFVAAVLSSFGVYFAFFGAILLIVSAIHGSIRDSSAKPIIRGGLFTLVIFIGVLANLAPNIVERFTREANPEVAQRFAQESELFSLKTIHLLLPQPDHRIAALADYTRTYQSTFPLSNTTSSLGVVGILGLLVAIFTVCQALAGKGVDPRKSLAAIAVLAILLIASPGGFSVVFAMLVTPAIRGWDRIAIFVNFGCLLALALALNESKKLLKQKYAPPALSALILIIGFLDQTPVSYRTIVNSAFATYDIDNGFIKEIESKLPSKSAIYQLPYFGFPESGPKNLLSVYSLGSAFFNSEQLRWSFGGMKGREGDLYYRALEQKPAAEQLEAVRKLGFSAIYIDKRGYADGADSLIKDFTKLLGAPLLTRADGAVVLFNIVPPLQ